MDSIYIEGNPVTKEEAYMETLIKACPKLKQVDSKIFNRTSTYTGPAPGAAKGGTKQDRVPPKASAILKEAMDK